MTGGSRGDRKQREQTGGNLAGSNMGAVGISMGVTGVVEINRGCQGAVGVTRVVEINRGCQGVVGVTEVVEINRGYQGAVGISMGVTGAVGINRG